MELNINKVVDKIVEQIDGGPLEWDSPWDELEFPLNNEDTKFSRSFLSDCIDCVSKPFNRINKAEEVFSTYITRNKLKFENRAANEAFYDLLEDEIVVPLQRQFSIPARYYSTIYHEAIHSTRHPSRLNRVIGAIDFVASVKEELIAEIGAVACLNLLGIESAKTIMNSAAYIQYYWRLLSNDKHYIFSATKKAEEAVRMIFGI